MTLAIVAALFMTGGLDALDTEQLRLLCGHPFYLDAAAAQVSLLSPHGIFAVCAALTLYLGIVLVRVRGFVQRTQLCFTALTAVILPGLLCVLCDGVLYVAAPVVAVCTLWCLTAVVPSVRRVLFS